jgi:hypothetical protein
MIILNELSRQTQFFVQVGAKDLHEKPTRVLKNFMSQDSYITQVPRFYPDLHDEFPAVFGARST